MTLPEELEKNIEKLLKPFSQKELEAASKDLSSRYLEKMSHFTPLHRLIYLAARMPATLQVLRSVLSHISLPSKIIDCGAGPGTSLWALKDFPVSSVVLVEKDLEFVKLGKKLAPEVPFSVEWKPQNFLSLKDEGDLILYSYSLNEVPPHEFEKVIEVGMEETRNFFLVIEPGTPEGFERVRWVRSYLLERGFSLHAPCPHHERCPMAGEDWCHFAVRVSRTSIHRKLKAGSRGFEDEKFSYLIASKLPHTPEGRRVLRRPIKRKGHTMATLCTHQGLEQGVFTGKKKKIRWGNLVE
ncbi:MAG: hypothetical protein KDK60_03310 [Chlamydiia bacterium]|nr:hypothetical protein [Chlamydiia bacterium]